MYVVNNELTEALYAEFPDLYRGHREPPEVSSMCWGFECGDGWFQLIHDLSRELTRYLEEHPSIDLEVKQVKEKFGSLRFHVRGGDEFTAKLIDDTCQRAKHVCELTGSEGRLCANDRDERRFSGSPVMVLCEQKAKELGYSPIAPERYF